MKPEDPYFNNIAIQLINPPQTTLTTLDEAAQGRSYPVSPEAEFSITSARSYVQAFLTDLWHPPEGTLFVPFPAENGCCDVVRAHYRVGDVRVRIAQSKYLIAIVVDGFRLEAGVNKAAHAQVVAEAVLRTPKRVEFEPVGPFDEGIFGVRKEPADGPIDDEWPHWTDELRWWYVDGVVGFITLKATGGPTRAEIGPQEELNRTWF